MRPAPIYLLLNGEADGPHEVEDIIDRIAEEELPETTLASIEGMPAWRALPETLLWAYAQLLPAFPPAQEWIQQIANSTLNVRDGG